MGSNFDSAITMQYITDPSSPQRFNTLFYTAPTSPAHFSVSYKEGDTARGRSLNAIPFEWEEKPGISKTNISTATSSNYGDAEENLDEIDFAFDFSCQSEQGSVSADELFDRGKIKPLKPPPRFQYDQNKSFDSPKSPRSPKKFIKDAFSPRQKKNDFDPFAAAAERSRTETVRENDGERKETENSSSRKTHDMFFDPGFNQEEPAKNLSTFRSVWYKKWRIKELSLFRAKENRVTTDKSQVQKHHLFEKTPQDGSIFKSLSFRSIDGNSETSISDHGLQHYTASKRDTEEMKKLTFLPCKQRLLGCLKYRKDLF